MAGADHDFGDHPQRVTVHGLGAARVVWVRIGAAREISVAALALIGRTSSVSILKRTRRRALRESGDQSDPPASGLEHQQAG